MADAESGSLAALGRSRDYYDGYEYACAVNYEYIAAPPALAGEGDLGLTAGDSAALAWLLWALISSMLGAGSALVLASRRRLERSFV